MGTASLFQSTPLWTALSDGRLRCPRHCWSHRVSIHPSVDCPFGRGHKAERLFSRGSFNPPLCGLPFRTIKYMLPN